MLSGSAPKERSRRGFMASRNENGRKRYFFGNQFFFCFSFILNK
jgi:hypothetical protein